MQAILIDCGACGRKLRIPEELLGRQVKCPSCQFTFMASGPTPANAETAAEADQPAAAPLPEAEVLEGDVQERAGIPTAQSELACSACGQRNPASAQHCLSCGSQLAKAREDRPWERQSGFRGRRDAEPHRGNLVLVLGILSIVVPWIGLALGIPAMVMGRSDLNKMKKNLMDREGQGLTQAGWVCGIVGTILGSFQCLLCMLWMGFAATVGIMSAKQAPVARPPAIRPAPVIPGEPPMDQEDD